TTVPYTYHEAVWAGVWQPVASGQLFDSTGRAIAPERWATMLPGESVALLSDDSFYGPPTIDPIYLAAFTPEILRLKVVYQPPPVAPEKIQPGPAIKGVKAPSIDPNYLAAFTQELQESKPLSVKTRPPLICLARLDSKGQLRLRQCSQQPMEYVIK